MAEPVDALVLINFPFEPNVIVAPTGGNSEPSEITGSLMVRFPVLSCACNISVWETPTGMVVVGALVVVVVGRMVLLVPVVVVPLPTGTHPAKTKRNTKNIF